MEQDMIPRYAPSKVVTVQGRAPVSQYVAHPPNAHPPKCPLVPECTALELRSEVGSRWYGVERAYINSELRMVVVGFPALFEEMAAWEKVPEGRQV